MIKKILIWCLAAFLVYHGVRIFLIESTRTSPKSGIEVFSTKLNNFTMSIIFLPKGKMITMINSGFSNCSQLLNQINRGGKKIAGNFYYLEKPSAIIDLFPFAISEDGFTPFLYEMEVISHEKSLEIIGVDCDNFLVPIGGRIETIMLHSADGNSLIYLEEKLEKNKDPSEEWITTVYKILEKNIQK